MPGRYESGGRRLRGIVSLTSPGSRSSFSFTSGTDVALPEYDPFESACDGRVVARALRRIGEGGLGGTGCRVLSGFGDLDFDCFLKVSRSSSGGSDWDACLSYRLGGGDT